MSEITKDLGCLCWLWEPLAYVGGPHGLYLELSSVVIQSDRMLLNMTPETGDPFQATILFSEYTTIGAVGGRINELSEGCIIEGPETHYISMNVVFGGGCHFEGEFGGWNSRFLKAGTYLDESQSWHVDLRFTLPDEGDVEKNVAYGMGGTGQKGTYVYFVSSGTPLLGYECKLYRNAGSYAEPDWAEITPVRDVTLNLEKSEVDATTRANGGWKASLGALKEGSVEFDIVWDPADAGFQALLDSYVNGTAVEVAVMDGPMQTPGKQGLRATMEVLKFTRVEGLEEAVVANVVVKPTLADHAPEWLVVPG